MTLGVSLKILVTGGAGYIGSQTCKALKQNNFEPIAYDNLSRGHSWTVKWGPLVKGDLSETEKLIRTINEYKIQAVVHFAAFAYVGESVKNPEMYYQNNFSGSLSLLKAMQATNLKKIIFSSSCATYGNPNTKTISEDHPQQPINPYGRSKLMVEKVMRDCHKAWGLQTCALRYFNAAGADLDGEIGEAHNPETHLIPLVLAAGMSSSPISVFGNDYLTPDGTCIRDYIHVQDLADAHVQALKRILAKDINFEAFNLGTGKGYSVQEVIDKTSQILGKKIPQILAERREGDPAILVAKVEKAKTELNWQAKYSDLEQIISSAADWAKKQ